MNTQIHESTRGHTRGVYITLAFLLYNTLS